MITSLVATAIFAMLVYAAARRAWLAIALPTIVGLTWMAYYMGVFRSGGSDSTTTGTFFGFSPVFAIAYAIASLVGVGIAAVLGSVVDKKKEE